TADATAFVSLMFGYFFFWTVHDDFPPPPSPGLDGPGWQWPLAALALIVLGWLLTLAARGSCARARMALVRVLLAAAALATLAGGAAGLAGPWTSGLTPELDVYPATVWIIAIWIAAHAAVGAIMQLYVLARSFTSRLTATYDADLRNVAVYHHFLAPSACIAFAVLGFFPELA